MSKNQNIVNVPLSSIVAENAWNIRYPGWDQDSGDEEVQNFVDLKASIEAHGIDTPLTVVPVGPRSKKYRLVAGFRRFRAASELELAEIPVSIKNYETESAIRSANLRENQERENLNVSDLCWGVKQLMEAYESEGEKKTQRELALEVGVSQGYISPLVTIAKGLSPKLLEDWRKNTYDIPFRKIAQVAALPQADQPAAFQALMGGPSGSREAHESNQSDKLRKKAATLGTIVGKLAWLGIDPHSPEFSDSDFSWEDLLDSKVKFKAAERKAMAKAAQAAYDAFLTEEEAEEEA